MRERKNKTYIPIKIIRNMERINIIGMGNYNNFNYLIIKKHENFSEIFTKVLESSFKYPPSIHSGGLEVANRNINKHIDQHESIDIENTRIDLFYGKEVIFLTFICSAKKRKAILDKFSEFEKKKA